MIKYKAGSLIKEEEEEEWEPELEEEEDKVEECILAGVDWENVCYQVSTNYFSTTPLS